MSAPPPEVAPAPAASAPHPVRGLHASLVCPMRADGTVDEAALLAHATAVLACEGLHGLLVNGHAGEGAALSRAEAQRVVSVARRAADATTGGRVPPSGPTDAAVSRPTVIAGVTAEASARAAVLARDAATAGADAIMVVAPPSWAGGADARAVLAHHRAIHDATALPLVLFQGVAGSGLHLPPEMLRVLLRLPRVCAIKEGSWDVDAYARTRALVREVRPEVAVLASGDEHLRPCMALGSEGSLVSLAAVTPELVVALGRAVRSGAQAEARAIEARLAPLAAAIYAATPPGLAAARLKACLHLLGRLPRPDARAPTPPLDADEREALRRALARAGLPVAREAPPAPEAASGAPPDAPWLHVVRVDVDPDRREAFDRWYDEEHVPALLRCPGWLSARRYLCEDGGPRHVAVYEIAGAWAYRTPEFAAVRGFGALAPFVHDFRRAVFAPAGADVSGVPAAAEDAGGSGGSGT